jgi:EmrB/QacA subfamily drug resistance transporter
VSADRPVADPPGVELSRRRPDRAATGSATLGRDREGSPPGLEARAPRRGAVLVVLCVSLLIVSLDTTILNVALPTIVRAMDASSSSLQWIVDAYSIVVAGLLLVVGSLGDRFGRKWILLLGLSIFAVGSAVSAFSGSPDRLIAARGFMGIGAACIMPATLSILTNVFVGDAERARAIGIWSATTGLGVAVGPVVGGWLLAHFWWGSVFLVNVPIAFFGVLAVIWLVPNSKNPAAKRPDPVGGVLSIVGMGLLLWGIIEAPDRSWTSPYVVGALSGALVVLVAFALWERRSSHPMLELSFFSSRRFSAAIGTMGLVIFALMGGLFLLTQYLQFSLGYTALETGVRVAPIAGVLFVVAPASTLIARKIGTKPVVFAGMVFIAVGFALVSRVTVGSVYTDVLPAFLCIGIGTGLAFAPCTESVMGSLPLDQTGVGSATNSAAQQTGGALGVGVLGSLLDTRYQGRMAPLLAHYPAPASVVHLITGSLGGALAVSQSIGGALGGELAAAARAAFVSGLDLAVEVGAIGVGVAAFVALLVLPSRGVDHRSSDVGTDRAAADE